MKLNLEYCVSMRNKLTSFKLAHVWVLLSFVGSSYTLTVQTEECYLSSHITAPHSLFLYVNQQEGSNTAASAAPPNKQHVTLTTTTDHSFTQKNKTAF